MKIAISFILVLGCMGVAWVGAGIAGMTTLFGVFIPYFALGTFLVGFVLKVLTWTKSPVPFAIQTTCGQGKALDWIPHNKLEAPNTKGEVAMRMLLEVLFFRSLFRNTKAEYTKGAGLTYGPEKLLWLLGILFHYSFLVVVLRHYRLFMAETPLMVTLLESVDGMLQITLPTMYLSGPLLVVGALALFARRALTPQVKYISQAADYFPLFLIAAIGITGLMMRYVTKADVVTAKELIQGLVGFSFTVPEGVAPIFYVHLFLVCVLAMYFPFSKLMHMGGVFLSPTRNMANNTREVRHVNPWNKPIKFRTYAEYEDDFRDKMKGAGLPLEKEPIAKEEKP